MYHLNARVIRVETDLTIVLFSTLVQHVGHGLGAMNQLVYFALLIILIRFACFISLVNHALVHRQEEVIIRCSEFRSKNFPSLCEAWVQIDFRLECLKVALMKHRVTHIKSLLSAIEKLTLIMNQAFQFLAIQSEFRHFLFLQLLLLFDLFGSQVFRCHFLLRRYFFISIDL